MDMMKALMGQVSSQQRQLAVLAAPRLRNVVAQVLLHACGQQSFRTSFMGLTPVAMARNADAVLTRCTAGVHPGSLQDLEGEVAAVRSLVTPELQQQCPQECHFLAAYEQQLKAAYPDRFGGKCTRD
ncbi:hypothetical protein HYH03_018306 [Edaphochlamys debaryana]|uniref:Uncharacterized protein n=1 Tax=Edaphochlamys debaryana TaxID=47281 RepID=A0A835XI63_9CHLO|nr:hypothetical protein HYH03_018306 [Edaphochlamys debaryana]|eukprot:KAG2482766.1 hypothetical protein HYH03_018306 [Edaphochlamys debaryana]